MLNMQKIFEAQDKLDRKVVKVHCLQDQNLNGDVTQALYTELGELSNEIGFFKYWKKNKRNDKARKYDEWADCLHFVASLGNKYGHVELILGTSRTYKIADKFIENECSFHKLLSKMYKADYSCIFEYSDALSALLAIGKKMGMSDEDMEKAYFEKNQVNYDRLASGY
ncbi:dUTP diphosphatase [Bacillus paranthracis]|uniref:dUTP diphosphatase n=1 Tax=Bacillus paranthracis TaxID=2026186 RepID=UPI000D6A9548|nr:dUTP diphosphatase [Bacillus paranthracis]MBL3848181.1 dUTP diphosphatase [Bacillus cereus]MCU4849955.1 dUTP diphosphatase [Bacillus paranthracis]MEC4621580.1 dUTP diphosphatase [Bacillus paranthracis]PWN69777.1 hypothetical protein CV741_27070 [Bacillus cereus]PWN77632.1 hypothetical protein CV717_26745 [Bacillus cereus]